MIKFDKVSKHYPTSQDALSNISFNLETGSLTFLTGHSGAGKSTLLRLLSMQESCSSGNIYVNGQSLREVKASYIPYLRRTMGLIFQSPNLLQGKTIFQNVALPLLIGNTPASEIGKRVRAALDLVGLLDKENNYPHQLSTGQQQRVGIARAVVHKPSLILADEPTGNLDPALSKDIMSLFSRLNEFGVTILIATHDLSLIATMCYPIYVLKQGRIVC